MSSFAGSVLFADKVKISAGIIPVAGSIILCPIFYRFLTLDLILSLLLQKKQLQHSLII